MLQIAGTFKSDYQSRAKKLYKKLNQTLDYSVKFKEYCVELEGYLDNVDEYFEKRNILVCKILLFFFLYKEN